VTRKLLCVWEGGLELTGGLNSGRSKGINIANDVEY